MLSAGIGCPHLISHAVFHISRARLLVQHILVTYGSFPFSPIPSDVTQTFHPGCQPGAEGQAALRGEAAPRGGVDQSDSECQVWTKHGENSSAWGRWPNETTGFELTSYFLLGGV